MGEASADGSMTISRAVVEDDGRMTTKKVQALCKESGGYNTPALNEKLYLHFKGWPRIENLDEFTGARVVRLEGNGLAKIENMQPMAGLRQMYLQQNCIKKMENLEGFDELVCINLSENFISKVENISHLPKLETLQLNNNNMVTLEDVEHLRECKNLRTLELSKNQIDDPAIVDVLAALPELRLLKLDGNPVVRKIPQYRKTLITRFRNLTYLDDRPVFEDERLTAEAWARGGIEAEKMERQRQRAAKKAKEDRRHKAFFEMIDKAKKDKKAADKAEARRRREREVADRNKSVTSSEDADEQEEARTKAQDALVDQLAAETVSRKSRGEGKRRTKCVISEVAEDAEATQKTKCNVVEVSELSAEAKAAGSKSRRAKSRKDREARLKAAMAAVEAECGDSDPVAEQASEPKQDAPSTRFAQMTDTQIEARLNADNEAAEDDRNNDEDAELIPAQGSQVKEASPKVFGTAKYDQVWAKATQMESKLADDEEVNVVADDMTALLDVEELD